MDTGLDALLIPGAEGTVHLAAPRVGRVTLTLSPGALVTAGASLGRLRTLNRSEVLRVPSGVEGRVHDVRHPERLAPVAWGEVLATIETGALGATDDRPQKAGEATLDAGEVIWNSPIEGQFYRRPAPDAHPYVDEGDVLESGTIVGLVEVMKFFHPVHFERVGRWRLVRFLVPEGAAVESGAPLAVLTRV